MLSPVKASFETEMRTEKERAEEYFSDCIEFTDYESDPDGYNSEPIKSS